ncbi:MAG: hypothetical protein JO322_05440 [Candidatus Eremiobacteraeota bacterium]|nr:hypothetical protein [Candidatus Eremiobacteraeota bacterium]
MNVHRLYPFCVALTILTSACSNGGETAVTPPASPAIANGGAAAKLSILIPQKATSSTVKQRMPQYVSPSSAQLNVAVNGGTASTYGLSPATPGCSTVQAQLACVFSIPAPAGNDSFALSLADGAGNVLSRNVVDATLTAGATTPVNVTLDAVPASVAIVPGTAATMDGNASTGYHIPGLFAQAVELEAIDADGNVIIGPGAPAIGTPVVSGSTNVSIVSANTSDPNAYLLKASAGAGGQTVSVSASAQGIPLSDGTTSTPVNSSQSFTYTPAIAVASGTTISAYSVESGKQVALWNACPGACSLTLATGAQSDTQGNLYVLVEYISGISQSRVVQVYPAGTKTMSLQMNSANGVTGAVSVALDSNHMLYVLNAASGFGLSHHAASITEYASGATTPTYTISGTLTKLSTPVSIGVDGHGNVYESDGAGYINIYKPGRQTAPFQQLIDATNLPAPSYMTVNSAGAIYVDDSSKKYLAYIAPGSTSVTKTISSSAFQGNPQDFIFDPAGNMWMSVNNSSIAEFSGSSLPTGASLLQTMSVNGALAWIP